MNKAIIILLTILYVGIGIVSAQPNPITFGDVSNTDFIDTKNDMLNSADAYVVCSYGKTELKNVSGEILVVTDVHVRIKVNKRAGTSYADIEIPHYRKDRLTRLVGKTYNLEKGIVIENDLTNDAIYKKEYNNVSLVSFALPNVKEGSIFEYSYHYESTNYYSIAPWEFQREIPVQWSEYRAEIPLALEYKIYAPGNIKFSVNEAKDNTMRFFGKTYNGKAYRWGINNIPAFEEEPYMTAPDDFMMQIKFELNKINFPNYTHSLLPSYKDINKELLKNPDFGLAIERRRFAKKIVAQLIQNKTTTEEKIDTIYNYITNKVRWNIRKGLFISQPLRQTLKKGVGTSADINLLLIAMLRQAGVIAYPVVLSTRDNGILPMHIALSGRINYVVAMVTIDDNKVLLDATDKYRPAGTLPFDCMNGKGLIVSTNGENWVNLKNKEAYNTNTFVDYSVDENGDVKGSYKVYLYGYAAVDARNSIKMNGVDVFEKENIVLPFGNIRFSNFKVENISQIKKPLVVSYSFDADEYAQTSDNTILLNPLGFIKNAENPLKARERKYTLNIGCPMIEKFNVNISYPDGYEAIQMPKQEKIRLNDAASYSFVLEQSAGKINLLITDNMSQDIVSTDEYESFRQFFLVALKKKEEIIILKKNKI